MTADTTFKEFVEEEGRSFLRLDVDSPDYRSLVERFNGAKLRLRAQEEARLHERATLLLTQNGHSAKAGPLALA